MPETLNFSTLNEIFCLNSFSTGTRKAFKIAVLSGESFSGVYTFWAETAKAKIKTIDKPNNDFFNIDLISNAWSPRMDVSD